MSLSSSHVYHIPSYHIKMFFSYQQGTFSYCTDKAVKIESDCQGEFIEYVNGPQTTSLTDGEVRFPLCEIVDVVDRKTGIFDFECYTKRRMGPRNPSQA